MRALAATGEGRVSIGTLVAMINDFLDLQRVQMGRLEFRMAKVNLADLVRDVANGPDFDEPQRRRVALDLAAVPPILADTERIRQVIRNLLSNAF